MANDTGLSQELETLRKRLQILEDKEAIRDVLARYAFNADLNRNDNFLKLWTDDCTFETDAGGLTIMKGKDEVMAHMLDTVHQSVTNRSQHLLLDCLINVDGDTATAAGYLLLTERWDGGFGIFRCAWRTFRFQRVDGAWLIKEAVSRSIGEAGCQELIPTEW